MIPNEYVITEIPVRIEMPPENVPVLMYITLEKTDKNVWTIGTWNAEKGWDCEYNRIGLPIVEYTIKYWYMLPNVRGYK